MWGQRSIDLGRFEGWWMTRGDPGGGRPTQSVAKRAATDAACFANPLYHHHHLLTHTNDRTPHSTCADLFRPPTTHTTHAIEPSIRMACTIQPPHCLWPGCPPTP